MAMQLMWKSFWLACSDVLRPRMLAYIVLPVLVFLAMVGLTSWLWWDEAHGNFLRWLSGLSWLEAWQAKLSARVASESWLAFAATLFTLALGLVMLVLAMLLLMVVASAVLAPVVAADVARRCYPALERRGDTSFIRSVWWAGRAFGVALLMLMVSLPFWLIPGVYVVVPPLIWGWLNGRVMSFDALSEFASGAELAQLIRQKRRALLFMGLVIGFLGAAPAIVWVSGLVFIALFAVLMPVAVIIYMAVLVLSALWFAHVGMAWLSELRAHPASISIISS